MSAYNFLLWQNAKKLLQGVRIGLSLGLSHEKGTWKRETFSHWWNRINGLKDFQQGKVSPNIQDEKGNVLIPLLKIRA